VGARVTAVCPTKHLDVVKSLGPDRIIDYQTEDFTKSGEKYSLIFDAVGKSSFGVCKALLIDGGAYVSTELGKNGQNVFMALIPGFLVKKHVLFPLPKTKVADMQLFGKLASEGKLKILHDRTYSLDQIVEAYQYVESAQKLGNVLIRMT
jgi:NADPH:quinone reductase-like Zn-dependent oxidoreductase